MNPLFGWSVGIPEMIVILIIGVLLFGRKLPDVGRYLGKGIVEFKKGIKGVEDDVDGSVTPRQEAQVAEAPKPPPRLTSNAPKFEEAAPKSNLTSTPPQI